MKRLNFHQGFAAKSIFVSLLFLIFPLIGQSNPVRVGDYVRLYGSDWEGFVTVVNGDSVIIRDDSGEIVDIDRSEVERLNHFRYDTRHRANFRHELGRVEVTSTGRNGQLTVSGQGPDGFITPREVDISEIGQRTTAISRNSFVVNRVTEDTARVVDIRAGYVLLEGNFQEGDGRVLVKKDHPMIKDSDFYELDKLKGPRISARITPATVRDYKEMNVERNGRGVTLGRGVSRDSIWGVTDNRAVISVQNNEPSNRIRRTGRGDRDFRRSGNRWNYIGIESSRDRFAPTELRGMRIEGRDLSLNVNRMTAFDDGVRVSGQLREGVLATSMDLKNDGSALRNAKIVQPAEKLNIVSEQGRRQIALRSRRPRLGGKLPTGITSSLFILGATTSILQANEDSNALEIAFGVVPAMAEETVCERISLENFREFFKGGCDISGEIEMDLEKWFNTPLHMRTEIRNEDSSLDRYLNERGYVKAEKLFCSEKAVDLAAIEYLPISRIEFSSEKRGDKFLQVNSKVYQQGLSTLPYVEFDLLSGKEGEDLSIIQASFPSKTSNSSFDRARAEVVSGKEFKEKYIAPEESGKTLTGRSQMAATSLNMSIFWEDQLNSCCGDRACRAFFEQKNSTNSGSRTLKNSRSGRI